MVAVDVLKAQLRHAETQRNHNGVALVNFDTVEENDKVQNRHGFKLVISKIQNLTF